MLRTHALQRHYVILAVTLRSHLSGLLIVKKRTIFLTPSAIARLIAVVSLVILLPTVTR